MTWEMFAKKANNSDVYYRIATYNGARSDIVLKVNDVERYGLRTQEYIHVLFKFSNK